MAEGSGLTGALERAMAEWKASPVGGHPCTSDWAFRKGWNAAVESRASAPNQVEALGHLGEEVARLRRALKSATWLDDDCDHLDCRHVGCGGCVRAEAIAALEAK